MTEILEKKSQPIDFAGLKDYFEQSLTPGQRADIRVNDPDDLELRPTFYRLIGKFLPKGAKPGGNWKRVVYFLPYAAHADKADRLGAAFAHAGVREIRMMQLERFESPHDLIQLRRLMQHVKPTVNWNQFGASLYYWNDENKRQLLKDYLHAKYIDKKGKGENHEEGE